MDAIFVGAGDVARQYAAGLAERSLSLAGVVDTDRDRARDFAEDRGAAAFCDLGDALEALDAPLVVNLTSHAAHAPVTRQCLRADRHVYSEKPLALEATTARALCDLAADRDVGLACAPANAEAPPGRHAGRAVADGRLGPVRLGYAHAHVGRVTDWHDRPASFLDVGPLFDGGVYPLTLLVSWFGPVERVRVADALDVWPESRGKPSAPSHVEATLAFDGPLTVRLTASLYAPHRSREFYGLELHGDHGSLYCDDAGALTVETDSVSFGRVGREYTPMPPQSPGRTASHLDGVARFASAVARGEAPTGSARRAAHVVGVCEAIEQAAETGNSVVPASEGVPVTSVARPTVRPSLEGIPSTASLRLPPVGFGCSRYRDGEYVDRVDSIATALDAGYRLLDVAELYGNEHRIGDLLAARGTPDRECLFVLGKVWNTNHGHVEEAIRGSLEELGLDAFDCYALHWPEAWAYQGPLRRLAERPVPEQEALTFPETGSGERATADISLVEAWANLEAVYRDGLTRTLGLCNVSVAQLRRVLEAGRVRPALVQVERHPYQPRTELVETCHERGIRVVAHSPLSAPGLLGEPVLEAIATARGLSPAGVVLAWNVTQGVVPIPASVDESHVVENLAAAAERLSPADCQRIAALADPSFER